MKRILFAAASLVIASSSAMAQQAAPMPGMGAKGADAPTMDMKNMDMKMMTHAPNDPPSTKGYKTAMMKMMHGMHQFSGDADIDFMKQMRAHHQGAIDMARTVLTTGKDAEVKKLAQEIIAAQEKEIVVINTWLK